MLNDKRYSLLLAGMLASLCVAAGGLFPSVLPWNDGVRSAPAGEVFEVTGNTYLDVQGALIALGEMLSPPTSRRSSRVEQAISKTEVGRGLRVDCDPDNTLLDRLIGDLERRTGSNTPPHGGEPGAWPTVLANLSTVVGAAGSFFFG